jgi:tetratricopeptide (TPR) repeat protein
MVIKHIYILIFVLFFVPVVTGAIVQEITPSVNSSDLLEENNFLISSYGENPTFYLYRALIYYNDGQFQAALEAARHAQEIEDTAQAWQFIGMSSARLCNHEAAADAFERVIRYQPEDPVVRNMYGASLTQIGEGSRAIGAFDKAISFDPEYAAAYNNRGVTQYILEKYGPCESSFKKAVRIDSDTSIYQANLAWMYYEKGDLKRAERTARDAQVLDRTNPHPYFILGNVAFDREEYRAAYFSYQSGFGQLLNAQQWYYAGISDFTKILNRRGANVIDSYYKSVAANALHQGTWDRINVVEYKIKRYEQSLEAEYDKILIIEPDYLTVWLQFGYSALQLGKIPEALKAYEEALKQDPQNLEALIGLAHVIGKGGDYTTAMELLDTIVAAHPDNGWGFYSCGEVQLSYGKYDEARTDFKKAIKAGFPKPTVYRSLEKIAIANEDPLMQTYYALRGLLAI